MTANFLWYAGTSSNTGLVTSALTIMSTELAGLTNGSLTLASSTTSGTASGIFNSGQYGQAPYADIFLTVGTSIGTGPSVGGVLQGWFLTSPDDTLFERSRVGFGQRPPDFVIAISTNSISAGDVFRTNNIVRLPALHWKLAVANALGITFASSNTANSTQKLAPYAMQY